MSIVPQHMEALARANHVKNTNAATCREIARMDQHAGRLKVAELLETDESYVFGRMSVEKLIESVYRFGPGASRMALRAIGSSHRGKRVGELTSRQRCALAALMRAGDPIGHWGSEAA